MKYSFLLLLLLPFNAWSQNITFFADTATLNTRVSKNWRSLSRVAEMEWKVGGQSMRFGSKPISLPIDPDKTDTLFFKWRANANWERILFNAKEPGAYAFIYNVCCDGFDIVRATNSNLGFISGKVSFQVSGRQQNQVLLGTFGEAGILIERGKNVLSRHCRSAMSSNIYWVTLQEIEICNDTTSCKQYACLYRKGFSEDDMYEISFKTISSKTEFLYMPLSDDPIQVFYDNKSGKLTVR